MPRTVLDSSVLVSAFVTPDGQVAKLLFSPVRGRYRLCLSGLILAETAGTLLQKPSLRRTYTYADRDVFDYVRWLITQSEMIDDVPEISAVPNDPKDNPIVATAVAAKADYLVSSDKAHLLPLGEYQGIRIVSPREFINLL